MHELSLAMSLIELAEKETVDSGNSRILSVKVIVGSVSGVDPDAFSFMLDLAKKNTMLEFAVINLDIVDGGELRVVSIEVE
ncbi:MAG: hydrogenase maturation nickel metallochaperone HypA [Bacteroidetes bacterium]|nr:hydrogenase maturation nickel metallochaperone HypA [Bacteroidota bacterium]